jgi:hypothetical protein
MGKINLFRCGPGGAVKWQSGLSLLLEAAHYAEDCRKPKWHFAVDFADLHTSGLTINDLRWLCAKGYIEHAVEIGPLSSCDHREFLQGKTSTFKRRSCVVLTNLGITFASQICHPSPPKPRAPSPAGQVSDAVATRVPRWDPKGRMLWLGSTLIKRFTVPATNQELVLAAFDQHGWPSCIDDPLPPSPAINPKRRLHDTINRLNRGHQRRLVRFSGSGNGLAIRWARVSRAQQIATKPAPQRV